MDELRQRLQEHRLVEERSSDHVDIRHMQVGFVSLLFGNAIVFIVYFYHSVVNKSCSNPLRL